MKKNTVEEAGSNPRPATFEVVRGEVGSEECPEAKGVRFVANHLRTLNHFKRDMGHEQAWGFSRGRSASK